MVEIAEIGDKESFETWLDDKPPELALLLAQRAAARVMPLYWAWAAKRSIGVDFPDIEIWRTLPTSRVRSVYAIPDLVGAVSAAADEALASYAKATAPASVEDSALISARAAANYAAFNDAARAADSARAAAVYARARAAPRASATDADIWAEIRHDAALYEGTDLRVSAPLWKTPPPPELLEAWQTTCAALEKRIKAGETGWQFWLDWYEAQLSGADQNWEMLKEIVLIPDEDWKQGAAHVNGLIEGIVARYRRDEPTALSRAFPVEFTFDSLARVMRMVGIVDDMAHLRDPAVVQSFLDDCEELRDSLQDFSDYAEAGREGKNRIAMLHLAASKVLNELQRTKDTDHLRARHIVQLAGRLEAFSKEEGAREELGETLSTILDDSIGLLRTVTRKHFGPAYTALAPLGQLALDHVDQDEVVALFDRMIARLEALPSDDLVALDEDGLSVFRDMIRELHEFRAAIAEASSEEFREVLEQRFAESIGGTGVAFGRFIEKSSAAADKIGVRAEYAVKTYRRVQGINDILEMIGGYLNGGGTP